MSEAALLQFSPRQQAAFWSRQPLLVWPGRRAEHSRTLAAWAVYRLLSRPGQIVDIFCGTKARATAFEALCFRICRLLGVPTAAGESRPEIHFPVQGQCSTLRVRLATVRQIRASHANDLILHNLAGCKDTPAVWLAAQAWTRLHPQGCCRIAGDARLADAPQRRKRVSA